MKPDFKWEFPYSSQRMPILAKNIVSTSQPLAAQAGLEMLRLGGNAVDAAIATAITLTVVEPVNNGIGSDAFAIIWDGNELHGLNASGRSPSAWTPEYFSKYNAMPFYGWDTVTVPGAVSAWVDLWKKFGNLEFEKLFQPAITYALNGFNISPITADVWKTAGRAYNKRKFPSFYNTFMKNGKAPSAGDFFKIPEQAETLKKIADSKGKAFYNGELSEKIVEYAKQTGGKITLEDFKNHKTTWENLISLQYRDITIHELPPNGQGLTVLIMLGILQNFNISQYKINSVESIHIQLEAMKLAFEDAYRYISDQSSLEFDISHLLKPDYLKERANLIDLKKTQEFKYGIPSDGDTVYLTTADENGLMVSYIQSNYFGFGSGIVVPETGISLQNRGNCFNLEKGHPNQVGPNKRPFHTIIPAFITRDNAPLMSFGVMGGAMQPQGHVQMITRIFEYKENPQAAIDAPRWRVMKGLNINVEKGFDEQSIAKLTTRGHKITYGHFFNFGGAQIIYKVDDVYLGASDPRKDGHAVGF